MDKKTVIIGIGNCGSQVASLAERKYPTLFDTICINTSATDLAQVSSTSLKIKIGKDEEQADIEGSGKNRSKMKEYLRAEISDIINNVKFKECLETKTYAFVVVSAAGGTGSGAGPVFVDIMQRYFMETNFVLVGVLPALKSLLVDQGNALGFIDEIYRNLSDATYMIYDNETTSNMPVTAGLTAVNENIVEDIRVLTGVDNFPTPYESIDEADMESIISTPGRLLVARINKNLTEKSLEDNDLDEMMIKAIKQSCHAETDRNKRIGKRGIITYFTEEVNKLFTTNFEKLMDFIGTPVEDFHHNAINKNKEEFNFIYLIVSGLSPINDRVTKMRERIDELNSVLPADESSKYIMDDNSVVSDVMAARKKLGRRNKTNEEFNSENIFSNYM